MTTRRVVALAAVIVCVAGLGLAQDEELPLANWSAPPYWNPLVHPRIEGVPQSGLVALAQGMRAQAQGLPSSPLPFVAIAPCRIVDTRVAVSDGFHQPNFIDDEARTFDVPNSPDCPGLPSTSGAWSVNIQFRPMSQLSYLTAYPTGNTRPTVSTLTAGAAAWVGNAAIIPAGRGGAIDIYCQFAGRVVIDINGYYGPQSVVTSLSTLAGDLTLAEGDNVTITPSTNTLTIAATGGPGGELPAGSTNQTLRNNGSSWVASSILTNDGTNVGIANNLVLPGTTSDGLSGVIEFGGHPFLHNYGPAADACNTFVGQQAGNFTMTASYNTGSGYQSLFSNTSGGLNTAVGCQSLFSNTSGWSNTAVGESSLFSNTTGGLNTAVGQWSLHSNTTGYHNTASGYRSIYANTTGYDNTASGYQAGDTNITGHGNTFVGASSDAGSSNLVNGTAIGANATVDASNHVRIGDTSVTQIGGQVAWSNLSDARAKTGIRDLQLGLDFVMALRPVSFSLTSGDGRTDMGFLAQDVEALLGDDYGLLGVGGDPERTLSLRYTDLIAPLVKAIHEQQDQLEAKDVRIAALEHAVDALQTTNKAQQTQFDELHRQVQAMLAAREGPKPVETVGN